jgi:carbohydrate-selective porin OprB
MIEPIKGRKDDCLGIAAAQSIVGEDYRVANDSESAETMYEIYYNFSLHPFVKFIPNLQVSTHPEAQKHSGTDVVAGVRLVIIF